MLSRSLCRLAAVLLLACTTAAEAQTATDAQRARARDIYRHAVNMDTSTEGRRVPELAAYLAGLFRTSGIPQADIHVIPYEQTAGLLVRYRGDGTGGRPILLMAHMDVVTAHRSDWERDPFTLVEENGFFYGRGALDNKSGLTLITATLLHLREEGFRPTRDLIVWFSGDEETTGYTTMDLLANHRELLGDVEYGINSDGGGGSLTPESQPVAYFMQTAEKTYADFVLTARNPGGHSSLPRADNAIFDLVDAINRVRAYQFPVMWNDTTIASFRAAAGNVGGQDGSALRRFAAHPGDRGAAAILSRNPAFVGQIRTTCVPTMLTGGHAENALPQSATVNVNCRIFPGVSPADVQAQLQRLAGDRITVEPKLEAHWSPASPLRDDVTNAITAAVHANYPNVPIIPAMAAGATDGVYFGGVGIPTYGAAEIFIRDQDEFSHGLNERNPSASFDNGLTHWRVLITMLAGPQS